MYSQANARAGKVLRHPVRALPFVIVVTEKVMREADGRVGRAALIAHFGWKGDRPGVRLESQTGEPVRSSKITSERSICFYPGQNGRCSEVIEKSKIGMSRHFRYVYHDTNGRKSWSSMEDPVVLVERNLYGQTLAGLLWERQFEKVLLK